MTYRAATDPLYDICLVCLQRGHCSGSCPSWKRKETAR